MIRFALAAVLLIWPATVSGLTTNIVGTSAAIQAQLNALSNGDTIVILPGTWVLTNAITHSRTVSINIRGSGTNNTTLISTNVAAAFNFSNSGTTPILISDIAFEGHVNNTSGIISAGKNPPSATPFQAFVRITRCSFVVRYRGLSLGYGDGRAVVDNCYFEVPSSGSVGNFNSFIAGGNEYISWQAASPLGTTNAVVYEDLTVANLSGQLGNGHWDAYNGSQFVVRYSLFDGAANTGSHGYDSDVTSSRTQEIYGNTFTNHSNAAAAALSRGGVFHFFSNTVHAATMATGGVAFIEYYRSAPGSYQGGRGYPSYAKTNLYAGNVTAATSTTLTDGNRNCWTWWVPSTIIGWTVTITGGTGSGQSRTITANGTTNITVAAWTTTPDATSTYAFTFPDGETETIGLAPAYTFKNTLVQSTSRQVKIGADLGETLTNLYYAINQTASEAGTRFSNATTNAANKNYDFSAIGVSGTELVLTNILDGTNGYPASQANGVLTVTKWTNTPVTLFPCHAWANTLNGTNVGFTLKWTAATSPCAFTEGIVVEGRDFTNAAPTSGYTPLAYPHPLRSVVVPDDDTLLVDSTPGGVTITKTPGYDGEDSISTPHTADHPTGHLVTLTAPALHLGSAFIKWQLNGVDYSVDEAITFAVEPDMEFEAFYQGQSSVGGKKSLPPGRLRRR